MHVRKSWCWRIVQEGKEGDVDLDLDGELVGGRRDPGSQACLKLSAKFTGSTKKLGSQVQC